MQRHLDRTLLQLISPHSEGLGMSDIEAELATRLTELPHRRTLQRHLQGLVERGELVRRGQSRSLVYAIDHKVCEPVDRNPHLTPEGRAIQAYVRRPRHSRTPVGFQATFLGDYSPGQTFYLPAQVRSELWHIGKANLNQQPAATHARRILDRLLIDLSWSSSRLEGNTYSRLDTQRLIEFGQAARGKDLRDARMILNHKAAIEMLVESADDLSVNAFTLLNLHSLLSQDLLADPSSSGRLRQRIVEISGTVYLPLALPQSLAEQFERLIHTARAIEDPFEQAFFLMVHLPYLQPFEDVNKRVSRLAANIPLLQHNLCPLSFVDLPEEDYVEGILGVYELNRVELLRDVFVWAYERSCHRYMAVKDSMRQPNPMGIQYQDAIIRAVQAVVRGQLHPTEAVIQRVVSQVLTSVTCPPSDLKSVEVLVTQALHDLHEGKIAVYRLSRAEFEGYQRELDGKGAP